MNTAKTIKILAIALAIASVGAMSTPKPAHAFTLFGIHFFEKAKPSTTPTPTPAPTATPTPTPTPSSSATPTPAGDNGNLPSTGPAESVGALLLAVVGGFVARKYWQVSHQI